MRNDRVDQGWNTDGTAGGFEAPFVAAVACSFMGDVRIRQRLAAMSIFAFGLRPCWVHWLAHVRSFF